MMIKKLTFLLILSGIFCSITSFDHKPKQKPVLKTIIIDPGHGGIDPGTTGLFSKEKNVALGISMKLGKAIEEEFPDIRIVYTRTTDILPGNANNIKDGLLNRAEIANKSKGDLFICIHANSNGHPPGSYKVSRVVGHKLVGKGKRKHRVPIYESYYVKNTVKGTASYIWKAEKGEDKVDAINETGGEDMGDSTGSAFDMNTPDARMRAMLYEKKYFANSALFATLIENEFQKAGRSSEGVRQRDKGIRVLQATAMPSVLIETGYLSNKEEEEFLNSEDGQAEVVKNIMDALKRYKDTLEGNHSSGKADTQAGKIASRGTRGFAKTGLR